MAGPPPPRYRVVERGRRLEVIDTWAAGGPPPQSITLRPSERPRDLAVPAPGASPVTNAARTLGRTGFTTSRLYDDKGPRRIAVDSDGQRQLETARNAAAFGVALAIVLIFLWWPILLVLPFLLASRQSRTAARAAVTRWLDKLDQATSASSPING